MFDDTDEFLKDLHPTDYRSLVVYSRDWTVATVLEQIEAGNIDLDPDFQRRNAWTDDKRSGLIESLIVGIPVPQIVFAENPKKRKSFIVIDGRQRLLTLAGFVKPETVKFWNKPQLKNLELRADLEGETYESLRLENPDALRELDNADVRCAVIASKEATNDLLYYVFYRLNSGSVSLSTQELRQALNRGPFSTYLGKLTSDKIDLHSVMGLKGPDDRYRDSEVLLRYFAFSLFLSDYRGNLKGFLDTAMSKLNLEYPKYENRLKTTYFRLNETITRLERIFGKDNVGKRPLLESNGYDRRFNRALFEVEVYFIKQISEAQLKGKMTKIKKAVEQLFEKNDSFRQSVTSTTKSLEQYSIRFSAMGEAVAKASGVELKIPDFT